MSSENVTIDELAAGLDQFGYDFDPYGYMDEVSSREEGFAQAIKSSYDIKAKEYAEPLIKYLLEG